MSVVPVEKSLFKNSELGRKLNVVTDIKTDVVCKKILDFLMANPYDYFTREELKVNCNTTFYVIQLSLRILLNTGEIEIVRKISRNNVYQLKGFTTRRKEIIDIYKEHLKNNCAK